MHYRFQIKNLWRLLCLLPVLALGLAACTPDDPWNFNICRIALPGIEDDATKIRLLTRFDEVTDPATVTLNYQLLTDTTASQPTPPPIHSLTCHFAGY